VSVYVRQRTELVGKAAYNVNHRWQILIRLTDNRRDVMATISIQCLKALCCATVILTAGCSSMKTPATADVAVSNAAVDNAAGAGGAEYAPAEMRSAREKVTLANQALAAKDYKRADDLANQAQADAKLAQSKADTAKAQAAANALEDDIHALRVEINRANQ
jgi:hypothetical protein